MPLQSDGHVSRGGGEGQQDHGQHSYIAEPGSRYTHHRGTAPSINYNTDTGLDVVFDLFPGQEYTITLCVCPPWGVLRTRKVIYTSVIIRDFWTATFEHTNLRFSAHSSLR